MPKHSSGQLASLLAGGPKTVKRFFAISVLAVISKPKKEKQESTRSTCLHIITRSHKEWELFRLKVQVSRSKRERACCFTRSFKETAIGYNSKTIRPICFKFCRVVALRGILQYTKQCHHNIICPDTALRIVLSEWLTRQMTGVSRTSARSWQG